MNEQEYMNGVIEKLNRMSEYEKRNIIAAKLNKDKINELVDFVNSILAKYEVTDTISKEHIRFYADFIGNIIKVSDKKLSHLIFDKYFPIPAGETYYHYTSFNASKSIIGSKKLRLSNLKRRFQHGEFSTFYEEHGMDGYKTGGTVMGVDCSENAIMSEIYFLSLTGSGYGFDTNSLWPDFGENGDGVRLEFKVTPKTSDFREVFYSTHKDKNCIPLLKELFTEIKSKYDVPFNFTYSSKIGAFYIRGRYQNENEFRFIIKRTSDDYEAMHIIPHIVDEATGVKYIEVDFLNDYADFELVSIQPGYKNSDEDIAEIDRLAKTTLGTKTTVLPKAIENYC
jgi:hypothetical protein